MDYELLKRLRGMTRKFSLMTTDLIIHNFDFIKGIQMEFPHSHLFHEIYFMLQGSTYTMIEDTKIKLNEGDLFYIGPGLSHYCIFNPLQESSYIVLTFEFTGNGEKSLHLDALREFMADEQYLIRNMVQNRFLHAQDTCGCKEEIDSLCATLSKKYMGSVIKIHSYLLNFFISALQSLSAIRQRQDFFEEIAHVGIINKAERIAAYIWEHCGESVTIHDVSKALQFSSRHLQRIISEYYNIRFSDMLTYCRIGVAKQLLCTTSHSIEYISCKCGFSSGQIMIHHFKILEGLSPSAYRKQFYIGAVFPLKKVPGFDPGLQRT